MKLIDILVERLPALGGWPIDSDDERTLISSLPGVSWGLNGGGYYAFRGPNDSITYQQYESALVASKLEWDGEGLPPVGCECEALYDSGRGEWFLAKILAHDNDAVIGRWLEGAGVYSLLDYSSPHGSFRPIRSEADKKKEAAIFAIAELCRSSASNGHSAELIYDAIKSGKIVID